MDCCIIVTVDETNLECFAHFEQNFLNKNHQTNWKLEEECNGKWQGKVTCWRNLFLSNGKQENRLICHINFIGELAYKSEKQDTLSNLSQ